ncbi:MAG: adenosine-specific kinase [Candidatus Schekmanbacteria bacterium]|nr:adenosine-specific kinase [Candidatus Schekmanbacteria bacterium]
MELEVVTIEKPEDVQVILGQSHFIRTVEDLHEALAISTPDIRFGVAFSEASGPCLVRRSGNDEELTELAATNLTRIASGHVFIAFLRGAFPIHVLGAIRNVPEVCRVFCASGNALQVVVARTELGGGVLGVIDGSAPRGVEGAADVARRKEFLRTIGLKL